MAAADARGPQRSQAPPIRILATAQGARKGPQKVLSAVGLLSNAAHTLRRVAATAAAKNSQMVPLTAAMPEAEAWALVRSRSFLMTGSSGAAANVTVGAQGGGGDGLMRGAWGGRP